ncbi:PTS fructose-like transporter subunit IIBC [Companilactobacillus kimchii]|uniref:Pts, eiibc n=3 Tax=Companilactobacillus kimchii TaxID=2801452 RepID=A0ABR5NWM5_9LACO|nr:PTS fructose-like transporter subunit IIBC [Companilactobacillus kimchii]KAE9559838.1 PTS subunit IIBC [Companilactobacillus kimchii]KRK53347.1 pts, eiibc [Companilactobacillus kimchii DSM 13961 = JCM 10707]OWF33374.1 Protein-N(pi)-phosphohistidine--sugar phosphotransferase [Companilactobacillus kimchii]GEO46453.1 PTS fructose transporter subunit IIBC [Companilactobacillus paralimentarius]
MTKIVAVTNCPAGIAHTYMVAEAIEEKAKSLGYEVHVETQGASGVENELTPKQIAEADYVILAIGKGLTDSDKARFDQKKVVELPVSEALKHIDTLFDDLEGNSHVMTSSKVKLGADQEVVTEGIMSYLMAGVSAALPFVIGGGLLIAIGSLMVQFGMPNTPLAKGTSPSIAWVITSIGNLGFQFMIPIMGAYIAYAISDKPAFAPAFLVTFLANDSDLLGTKSGAGFLGAIVIGLSIGYFVKYFKKIKLGKNFQSILPFMIIPFVTLLIFGLLTYYLLGPAMAWLMSVLLSFLQNIPTSMKIVGGFIVGAMLAFDMGGPINKTAWFFSFSLLSSHVFNWYGIVGVVTLLPPMAAAIATWIKPNLFTKQERAASWSAFIVGSTVATEPAIPYALAAPLPMITANTLAGGITGAITILLNVERTAPGIGIFDPLLGLESPWYWFYLCVAIGLVLNVSFIIIFKGIWLKRKEEKEKQAA